MSSLSYIAQLSSGPCSFFEQKAIGYNCPLESRYPICPPSTQSEASVSTSYSFSGSVLINTSSSNIRYLISQKAVSASFVQLNFKSFFVIFVSRMAIFPQLATYFRQKLVNTKNDRTSVTVVGIGYSRNALSLSGSIFYSPRDIIYLRNFIVFL